MRKGKKETKKERKRKGKRKKGRQLYGSNRLTCQGEQYIIMYEQRIKVN